jgi:hypothetical protein
MTAVTVMCDACGKIITGEVYKYLYDGTDRCERCHLIEEIKSRTLYVDEKQKQIEERHLKPLEEKREEIKKLKLKLKSLDCLNSVKEKK